MVFVVPKIGTLGITVDVLDMGTTGSLGFCAVIPRVGPD